MIVTVTLNAAMDQTLVLPNFVAGEVDILRSRGRVEPVKSLVGSNG